MCLIWYLRQEIILILIGAITPEFVNTPEGASTGDELELNQSELQYEKKVQNVQRVLSNKYKDFLYIINSLIYSL